MRKVTNTNEEETKERISKNVGICNRDKKGRRQGCMEIERGGRRGEGRDEWMVH